MINLYRSLKSNSLDILRPLRDRNLVEKHVGVLDFYYIVLRWQENMFSVEDVVEIVLAGWHIVCQLQQVI